MELREFLLKCVTATDAVHGEDCADKGVSYEGELMKILDIVIPAVSYHILEAALIKYQQEAGVKIPDYNPYEGIDSPVPPRFA